MDKCGDWKTHSPAQACSVTQELINMHIKKAIVHCKKMARVFTVTYGQCQSVLSAKFQMKWGESEPEYKEYENLK